MGRPNHSRTRSSSLPAPDAASAVKSRCSAPPKAPKVVVNDPGGAADGSGSSATPAGEVVDEIKSAGGTAVANFETVAEAIPASRIVKMAVDTYGKLDGVVNNAGILRDAIFHRMSVDAFESVIKVHLMGSFYVLAPRPGCSTSRQAARSCTSPRPPASSVITARPIMPPPKLGIVGPCPSRSRSTWRGSNVRSNGIKPFAWSRLIGTIPGRNRAEKAPRG